MTAESAAYSNASRSCCCLRRAQPGFWPVESLTVRNRPNVSPLTLSTRATLPSYSLRGYKGRGFSYAHGDIPIEVKDVELPKLLPGKAADVEFSFSLLDVPHRVRFEVDAPYSGSCVLPGVAAMRTAMRHGSEPPTKRCQGARFPPAIQCDTNIIFPLIC